MPLSCWEPKAGRNLKLALPSIASLLECLIQPIPWTVLYWRGSGEEICVLHLHFINAVPI